MIIIVINRCNNNHFRKYKVLQPNIQHILYPESNNLSYSSKYQNELSIDNESRIE